MTQHTETLCNSSEPTEKLLAYAWLKILDAWQPLELITNGCTSWFLPCGLNSFMKLMTIPLLNTL